MISILFSFCIFFVFNKSHGITSLVSVLINVLFKILPLPSLDEINAKPSVQVSAHVVQKSSMPSFFLFSRNVLCAWKAIL